MRTVTTGEFEGGSVFIDGDWKPLSEAKISLFDWGFTRSDATYDVVSAWHGAFFRLDDHLDRFFASLAKMRMTIPYSPRRGAPDPARLRQGRPACATPTSRWSARAACRRAASRDPRLATNRFYAYALPFVWIAPPEKQRAGHRPARQQAPAHRPRVGRPDDQELPLDRPRPLALRRLRPRRRHQLRRRRPGQRRRGAGLQRLHGQGRRRADARSRRARGHLAPDRDRALRRARHPAARRAGAGARPRRRRRGLPQLERRRRPADREDRRPAARRRLPGADDAAPARRLLGAARGPAPSRSGRRTDGPCVFGPGRPSWAGVLRRSADSRPTGATYLCGTRHPASRRPRP